MATLAEIRFDVLNKLRGGRASDDDLISYRQIDFNIKKKRAYLLESELRKGDKLNQQFLQTLPCLDLELVDKSECCEIKTNCKILRTTVKVPSVMNNLFSYIGPIDGSYSYQLISNLRSRWSSNGPFTGLLPKAYYLNGYMYITSEKLLEKLKIQAVFEDPSALAEIDLCNGPCFDEDNSDFPIPVYLVDNLINLVLRDMEIILKTESEYDDKNDGVSKIPRYDRRA